MIGRPRRPRPHGWKSNPYNALLQAPGPAMKSSKDPAQNVPAEPLLPSDDWQGVSIEISFDSYANNTDALATR